ncbi:ATP synthase F1 subunit epsilon [Helicobacter pametensis]|uniref:ATP synthase F1 subunit epsilon n=1 Tax=Helicobacter pametensis TaxID=95149 RepID=UPI000480BBD5|nr:ATP synthase F1 subunit epsilon [Helicobacter pametensis]
MEEIRVSIVTPEGLIFDGNVSSVTLPGSDGEFGVYPNHCSLISLLRAGVIEIITNQHTKEYVAIDWGYARVETDRVDILANGAVSINDGEIAKNLEKAKVLLKKASVGDALLAASFYKLECLAER